MRAHSPVSACTVRSKMRNGVDVWSGESTASSHTMTPLAFRSAASAASSAYAFWPVVAAARRTS